MEDDGFESPGVPPEPGTEGGMVTSGTTVKLSAQRLPPQPKGWPRNDAAPVIHGAGDSET